MSDPAKPDQPARLRRRKILRVVLIALAVLVPAGTVGGMQTWKYIKTNPNFCQTCHLMKDAAEKWKHSVHKEVACQTCHRADIFEEARLGYEAFIHSPEKVPPHTKVNIAVCEECHVSADPRWKQIAATPGHRVHFVSRDISCLTCHVTRVHEFQADTSKCLQCHGQGKLKLEKMEKLHCLGCHDFLGKDPANGGSLRPKAAKCRECHAPSKEVVLATPLAGKPAPTWKGHEDCLGCHRPHGKALDDPIDCLSCHRKLLEPSSAHYKDERLGEKCRECHEPHQPKN
jgi:nitrate/TMAO reductase-like tetraheme cytochrome c subunit